MSRPGSERGSAVVDFVLILGLLVPLFLGVLQVALVMFVRNTLASAASEGARYAATVGHTPGDGILRARQQLDRVLAARYADEVTARATTIGGAPAVTVLIHAEVPALGIGGPAIVVDVTGRAIQEQQ